VRQVVINSIDRVLRSTANLVHPERGWVCDCMQDGQSGPRRVVPQFTSSGVQ
jgi:hypothetical protein